MGGMRKYWLKLWTGSTYFLAPRIPEMTSFSAAPELALRLLDYGDDLAAKALHNLRMAYKQTARLLY